MRRGSWFALLVAVFAASLTGSAAASGGGATDVAAFGWTKLTGTPGWTGRAGLQAAELRNTLFVMGGRTPAPSAFDPFGSILWNDVWASRDAGTSWSKVTDAPWAARAYFQTVTLRGAMIVIGGQNFTVAPNPACSFGPVGPVCPPLQPPFVPASTFFADVWRSTDGARWTRLTDAAPFGGRAGLSAIVFKGWIYVLGGSRGDDVAIGGTGRVLFNDVWRSRDGKTWTRVTADAPWAPRAGAAVVEKNGYLYLLGGEDGFLCSNGADGLSCPYFNDVWRSRDGARWELVTASAGWSPRPGHQCQTLHDQIVCFGGFGWPTTAYPGPPGPGNPLVPTHPADVWTSRDGASWTKVSDSPWNATSSGDVKYDFDSLVVPNSGHGPSIFTFGGDREISFAMPDAGLVDADVWRFGPR